jgi:hypothetical protein
MESVGRETKRGRKQKARKVREILEAVKARMEAEMPEGHGFIVLAYKCKGKKKLRVAASVDRLEQYRAADDFLVLAERRLNGR